ncbi:ABC transporter permease [Levilinea saccharolytica]|uniref:ABC transporter permease n=1 Tax=Levilinea saccharolytica TaxID=229921 RepID=A0A0P6XSH7_9CHLR|nr:ABC transporter permease [Levilinea saccharolytica]KPL75659.1 hypothetical protein ADN01_17660 [Levilinea saccharolytica]GAP16591.1 ABC-type transport system related with lipoprotein release, permease component [Levilinea saccharolytica]
MFKIWKIAFRDLVRNRRRSLLTLLAIVIGVSLLLFTGSFYDGVFAGSLDMSIHLQTSDLQIRAQSYDADKISLDWKDLIENPQDLTGQIEAIQGVQAVTPVLWASGMLLSGSESVGVQINGIDPRSPIYDPIRQALTSGEMFAADDRGGVLVGESLAKSLGLSVGQNITLVTNTANRETDQAAFTIRGLFDTGVAQYDDSTIYMPLEKAQTFTAAGTRASAIRILLNDRTQAESYAAAFAAPGLQVLTWKQLNSILMDSVNASAAFIQLLYFIVLGMVAVVIANTLLMSVFERTREMGILSALGMKSRQILGMFLLEAGMLAVVGVALGVLFGGLIVYYYSQVGISFGQDIMEVKASNMITYGKVLYTQFSALKTMQLSLTALIMILLVAVYPASFAARLQPVQSLHGK